jgi:hypothetical protein
MEHQLALKYKNNAITHTKNPTRWKIVSKFLFHIYMKLNVFRATHTAHHQEPKTALAASGFAYVEGCWTCNCWTLSGRV